MSDKTAKKIIKDSDSIKIVQEEADEEGAYREDLGYSFGYYHATEAAIKAYEMDEMDEYIEWVRPKTIEEWDATILKYGENYDERWMCEGELKRLEKLREESKLHNELKVDDKN